MCKPTISYLFATPLVKNPKNYRESFGFGPIPVRNYIPYHVLGLYGLLKEKCEYVPVKWLKNTIFIMPTTSSLFEFIFISGQYDLHEMLLIKKVLKKGIFL